MLSGLRKCVSYVPYTPYLFFIAYLELGQGIIGDIYDGHCLSLHSVIFIPVLG